MSNKDDIPVIVPSRGTVHWTPVNVGGHRHRGAPLTSKQVPELQYEPKRLQSKLVVVVGAWVVVVVVNRIPQRIPVHPA